MAERGTSGAGRSLTALARNASPGSSPPRHLTAPRKQSPGFTQGLLSLASFLHRLQIQAQSCDIYTIFGLLVRHWLTCFVRGSCATGSGIHEVMGTSAHGIPDIGQGVAPY